MAYTDLRQFMAELGTLDRLRHVTREVDKDWELACIARWVIESFPAAEQFALQFDNVRGFPVPVVVGLYASYEMYAMGLQTTPDRLLGRWAAALHEPVPPINVDAGPAKEIIRTGADVNLLDLPIPVWTPGRDGGPYIPSASVITKDPESGVQNMGVYRVQVHDRSRTGLFFGTDRQHGAIHYARYCRRKEPMPVAIVIGGPPAVQFAAAAKTAYGVDELDIAGGLAGSAVEVMPAETVDLVVPAGAEYVIEGLVQPDDRFDEGPFGEALGYMNLAAPAPVVHVSAVCCRADPVFHGYVQQLPPSEGHIVWEMGTLGPLWYYLREKMNLDAIRDLAIIRGSAGISMLAVQLALGRGDETSQVARVLSGINFGQKFVIFVDEDIDIRDLETLQWAFSTRVDPTRDVQILPDVTSYQLDPSVLAGLDTGLEDIPPPPYSSSMMIIDATVKCDTPEISLPSASYMADTRKRWDQYGLPSLPVRQRLNQLLHYHAGGGDRFHLSPPKPGPPSTTAS